jgi:septum formation protein
VEISEKEDLHSRKKEDSFILGSSSKHRLEILKILGLLPGKVLSPDIDESPKKKELPHIYAQRMAMEKAQKLYSQYAGENILTADTVACCGRRILPKALTDDDVKFCLNMVSGRRHRVYTSICLVTSNGEFRQKTITTILKFKRLSDDEMKFYLLTGEGIGKAGGYSIQGIAQSFILWIRGSYLSVVGLPAYETVSLLKSVGVFQKHDQ